VDERWYIRVTWILFHAVEIMGEFREGAICLFELYTVQKGKFLNKLLAWEEPFFLATRHFPGLNTWQRCFCDQRLRPGHTRHPLAGFKGATLWQGRNGQERRVRDEGRGRNEGRHGWEGTGSRRFAHSFSQYPSPSLKVLCGLMRMSYVKSGFSLIRT